MKNKVSIHDVAKYVGVSSASVSYVLNGVDKVSEETKNRILKGIEELGYVPDNSARYLSTGISHSVCLLFPTTVSQAFRENPFYGEFIGSLEEELDKKGYDLSISSIDRLSNSKEWFLSHSFDALVIIGLFPKEVYLTVKELDIPVVLIDSYEEYSKEFFNIRINDEEGSYLATKYLIENGHKNITFVSGNTESSNLDLKRYNGYVKALKEANININPNYKFQTPVSFENGYKIATKVLKYKEVTACVCAADIVAIGMMKKCSELGKKLPDELSIIGFDDIKGSSFIYPGLTTVHQDINEKGRIAGTIILKELTNKSINVRTVELQPKIVVRESVKNIKM